MTDIIDREQALMDLLASEWDTTQVRGYDVNDGSLPMADSIHNVGAVYPSLVVTYSNETSPGDSSYSYQSNTGPGSINNGTLIATARAEEKDTGYENDGGTAVDADTIAKEIIHHVREIVRSNPTGGSTDFNILGTTKGADIPDDLEQTPPVMMEQANILYAFDETPN